MLGSSDVYLHEVVDLLFHGCFTFDNFFDYSKLHQHRQELFYFRGLDYPVNVGRNIAREEANSYFIFASDIELYPSAGLIPAFLEMIRTNETLMNWPKPRVFVSSIFEIEANAKMPENKKELILLLSNHTAVPFHSKICSECHAIPKSDEWIKAPVTSKTYSIVTGSVGCSVGRVVASASNT